MANQYWYVCHVNPVPWQIGPISAHPGKGGKGYYARVGRDEELHTYKEAIKESLLKQSPVKLEGLLSITCFFWRHRVASTSLKTDKALIKSVADTTNMIKSTEDACQGILYDNDKVNKMVRGFTIDQGPDVEGQVVICLEPLEAGWQDTVLQLIPDEVYAKTALSAAEQLALGLHMPKEKIGTEDDEYAAGQDLF